MKTSLLAEHIREVKDFPKEGISFKDITPILSNPELSTKVIDSFIEFLNDKDMQKCNLCIFHIQFMFVLTL